MAHYTQEEIDENRREWLAQLRDPESKKTIGELESYDDTNERCCLGHACYALNIHCDINITDRTVSYDTEAGKLPNSACRKLNIDRIGRLNNDILLSDDDEYDNFYISNLTTLNDDTDLSPQEIADIIEDQFKTNNFKPFEEDLWDEYDD